jgi:hypothetical protein
VWITSRSVPKAARSAEICKCRFFSVTIRPGHTRRINSSLLTTLPRPSSNAIQRVEGAPAELDWLAVGQQLAAMRQHLETTERDTRRRIGVGIHRIHRLCL